MRKGLVSVSPLCTLFYLEARVQKVFLCRESVLAAEASELQRRKEGVDLLGGPAQHPSRAELPGPHTPLSRAADACPRNPPPARLLQ